MHPGRGPAQRLERRLPRGMQALLVSWRQQPASLGKLCTALSPPGACCAACPQFSAHPPTLPPRRFLACFRADLPKECKEIVDSLGIISPTDASGKPMKARWAAAPQSGKWLGVAGGVFGQRLQASHKLCAVMCGGRPLLVARRSQRRT